MHLKDLFVDGLQAIFLHHLTFLCQITFFKIVFFFLTLFKVIIYLIGEAWAEPVNALERDATCRCRHRLCFHL